MFLVLAVQSMGVTQFWTRSSYIHNVVKGKTLVVFHRAHPDGSVVVTVCALPACCRSDRPPDGDVWTKKINLMCLPVTLDKMKTPTENLRFNEVFTHHWHATTKRYVTQQQILIQKKAFHIISLYGQHHTWHYNETSKRSLNPASKSYFHHKCFSEDSIRWENHGCHPVLPQVWSLPYNQKIHFFFKWILMVVMFCLVFHPL